MLEYGLYFDFEELPRDLLPQKLVEGLVAVQVVPHSGKVNVEEGHLLPGDLGHLNVGPDLLVFLSSLVAVFGLQVRIKKLVKLIETRSGMLLLFYLPVCSPP